MARWLHQFHAVVIFRVVRCSDYYACYQASFHGPQSHQHTAPDIHHSIQRFQALCTRALCPSLEYYGGQQYLRPNIPAEPNMSCLYDDRSKPFSKHSATWVLCPRMQLLDWKARKQGNMAGRRVSAAIVVCTLSERCRLTSLLSRVLQASQLHWRLT